MCEASQMISSLDHPLSVEEAIDNLRSLGDVGQTNLYFLDRILSHCTVDQLMHVESSSKGRDLSPVTDKLWKKFYEQKFGEDDTNSVIERMQNKKNSFRWKQLYEAKMNELEKKSRQIEDRFIQNYQKEKARKQSRQIKLCCDVPLPSNKKRSFEQMNQLECNTAKSKFLKKTKEEAQVCEASSVGNKKQSFERTVGLGQNTKKGKLLKKAKRQMLQSIEMKNLIVFRRNAVQKI